MQTKNYTIVHPADLNNLVNTHHITDSRRLLIQVFSGRAEYRFIVQLQAELKRYFKEATIIGTTTDGAIMSGNVVLNHSSVLSFTQFEKTNLYTAFIHHKDKDSFHTGTALAHQLAPYHPNALICFGDGLHTNGERLLNGLDALLNNTVIAGGLAGDNGHLSQTFVFDNNHITDNGIVAVGLSNPQLHTVSHFNFDWMPIGLDKKVTKADQNRVYTIDNMSAVDFYAKYLGKKIADQLPKIGIEFPLLILRGDEYVGRAVLEKHGDGSLVFAGNINEGDSIRFGIGNTEIILQNSTASIAQLQQQGIESIFIYSCMARRRFLGDHIDNELRPLQAKATTAGFFTYGEFYHTRLLNESMTYLALSERTDKIALEQDLSQAATVESDHDLNTFQALSHLANAMSHELNSLNGSLESKVDEQTREIFTQLYFDPLTSLPNRSKLISVLSNHHNNYLLLFNVDRFSQINNFYGFDAGDKLLQSLALLLTQKFSSVGTIYKLPSDEFTLIIEEREIQINDFIEKLIPEFSRLSSAYHDLKIPYTITVGAAMINAQGRGLRNAKTALEHAKLLRDPFVFYSDIEQSNQNIEKNLLMASTIREAFSQERLCMHYQPIIDLKSMKIVSYESLARICLDDRMLMPGEFLPVVHYMKLHNSFTRKVIRQTFAFFENSTEQFSINLGIDDILNKKTVAFIHEMLKRFNTGSRLTFEILETTQLQNIPEVIDFIDAMKEQGVKIAIDDFGSGFANFINLTKIHADTLKIDGSLIKDIDTDPHARVVVETIVTFAKKLGMKTVAEYIHSKEVLEVVKKTGVDLAQGFYLAKPSATL